MSHPARRATTPQMSLDPTPAAPGLDGRRLGLALGTLVLPMYVALGAPSVALPAIGRALAVPFEATAWILAAWSLTSAIAMPVAGRLLARWSPFQVLVTGVITLAGGSALAAGGPTLSIVIIGRLIGGAGAGATVVGVSSAATALAGRQRIRALAMIAAASATASGSGTLLGGALTAWLGWRAVLGVPVLALPLLLVAWPIRHALTRSRGCTRRSPIGRFDVVGAAVLSLLAGSLVTVLQAHSLGFPAPITLAVASTGVLAAVGLWWRVRTTPDGFVPRRVVASRGFPAAGVIGGTVFAGYYGVLFCAPSMIEQATGAGPLEAGVLLVPAAVCSVLTGRLVGRLTARFTAWQVSAALAALTVAGVLIVAVFPEPVAIIAGTALAVCGFAGVQAVLVNLAPDLVAAGDRDTAQSLLNFMNALGGGLGPAVVAGLSGIVATPMALMVLAALPMAGLVIALNRRPAADHHPEPTRRSSRPRTPAPDPTHR